MSYASRITGEMTIDPPLQWAAYRDTDLWCETLPLQLREVTTATEYEDGVLTRRRVTALVPRGDRCYDTSFIVPTIEVLRGLCREHGSVLSGTLYSEGEDGALDIWRYRHAGNLLVVEQAVLVWPDGTGAYVEQSNPDFPGVMKVLGYGPPRFDQIGATR